MHIGGMLGGKRKSNSGQAPVLAAIFFLLLVPTTVIIAENATSNITGMLVNISPANSTSNTTEIPIFNTSETPAQIFTDNTTSPVNISIPLNTSGNAPGNETNISVVYDNATTNVTLLKNWTNATVPEEDATSGINATFPANETSGTVSWNATSTAPTEPVSDGPVLDVSIDMPDRADRNQPLTVTATVTNTGDIEGKDVELEWVLPSDIQLLEGSGNHRCHIPSNAACQSEIVVAAPLSSNLGKHDIKVLVRYHD